VRLLNFTVRGHFLRLPVFLVAAGLILGVIGFVRAVAEFGTPGVIAFAKLILGPAVAVLLLFVLAAGRYTGEIPRLRAVVIFVGALTGVACALSAAFGVAWLVTK
jgi:hypothetical protein